jgi:hypothetical protein
MNNNIPNIGSNQAIEEALEDKINDASALCETIGLFIDCAIAHDCESVELNVMSRLSEQLLDKLNHCQTLAVSQLKQVA